MEPGAAGALSRSSNALACQRDTTGQFATFFLMAIDERTMTLRSTNAGHTFPVLLRAEDTRGLLEKGGLVVGLPRTHFAEDIALSVLEGVRAFLGETEAGDDITVLALRVTAARDRRPPRLTARRPGRPFVRRMLLPRRLLRRKLVHMTHHRRQSSSRRAARTLLRTILFAPLWAVPFALFFGTLFGTLGASYLEAYKSRSSSRSSIRLALCATARWLVPALRIPAADSGVAADRRRLPGRRACTASYVAAFLTQRVPVSRFCSAARAAWSRRGLYGLLFSGLFMGIIMARHFYATSVERAAQVERIRGRARPRRVARAAGPGATRTSSSTRSTRSPR